MGSGHQTAATASAEVSDALADSTRRAGRDRACPVVGPYALLALQRSAGNAAVSALLAAKPRSPGEQAVNKIDAALKEIRRDEPAIDTVEKGLKAAKVAEPPVAPIAHDLAYVQQHDRAPVVQRQPKKPPKKSKFDFVLADVEGQQKVVSVLRPTDPAEFLQAFQEKGSELIDAEAKWSSNNLIQFVADSVKKLKRNPFANLKKEDMLGIAQQTYEKAVGALAVRGASEAGSRILKIINVGKKAAGRISGVGGVISWIGGALVQYMIGPFFDKSDVLARLAVDQVAEGASKVVNEIIIPTVRTSATEFSGFMAALSQYMLQDRDKPHPKVEAKGGAKSFSVGEGEYKVTIEIDMNKPLTDEMMEKIMVDLGNVVLGIDDVVPKLETDLSLRDALALKAGVFTGDVVPASPGPAPRKPWPVRAPGERSQSRGSMGPVPFRVGKLLVGGIKFNWPAGTEVAIQSEARYDLDPDMAERAEQVYQIQLYRGKEAEHKPRRYHVGKLETGEWYKLKGGEYHVVITKGGNPNSILEGNLTFESIEP